MSGYVYTGGELLTMHEIDRIVDAVRNIGNGDYGQGEIILLELSDRLHHARGKHPVFAVGMYHALGVISSEHEELVRAVEKEGVVRAQDECLDVMATCIRFSGQEWE